MDGITRSSGKHSTRSKVIQAKYDAVPEQGAELVFAELAIAVEVQQRESALEQLILLRVHLYSSGIASHRTIAFTEYTLRGDVVIGAPARTAPGGWRHD